MTISQQLYADSQRNSPENAREAYDLLRVFLKDEFDPGLAEGFLESLDREPDPDVAERRASYVEGASRLINDEDQIDEDAWVSESATGAYVQTWTWVSKYDV